MMQGFDKKFRNFTDYIIGITKEIWEDRGLATLNHYYAPNIIVRAPNAIVQGNQGVIAATMATLNEFPDRRLLGEDVIWCGTPETGMLSSHRILSTATHTHDGVYGKATGKQLTYRIIADCHAKNNQIDDEWLIRDQAAIVRQLGLTPEDYARELIIKEGGLEQAVKPYLPENDIAGPYQSKGNDNEWGARLSELLTTLMQAEFSAIPKHYDRAANLYYPSGVTTYSADGADRFWLGVRSSFPNATFKIHHQMGRDDALMPPRAAVRWSLDGTHDGYGYFGKPTGQRVHIMGITHVEFGAFTSESHSGKASIRREYTLFDETAIWKQILLGNGNI